VRSFTAHWIGRVMYEDAHALQERLLASRIKGEIGDTLLLLEHDAVITTGRAYDRANILVSDEARAEMGIDFVETGRGGDVTYHAPGQLVAYPIFDLKPERCDVRKYVRDLAKVMIDLAADHGIVAGRLDDAKRIGVWVNTDDPARWSEGESEREEQHLAKIGAIGVRISRWVTMHGFAFNVSTDLAGFKLIVPCGISAHGVTSLQDLGVAPGTSIEAVAMRAVTHFARTFDADARIATKDETTALLSESNLKFRDS
jgi:lipoyl(octanoyl) transferase